PPAPPAVAQPTVAATAPTPVKKTKKLGYKEQRELEMLPALIEKLETEQEALVAKIGDPDFYQQEVSVVTAAQTRMIELENELLAAYARWEELDG
ncbi:MAG: ABC transporter ATP-binding protein, partial [Limnobacter sp.]